MNRYKMDSNLYKALAFWQDKYDKEHQKVEKLEERIGQLELRLKEEGNED